MNSLPKEKNFDETNPMIKSSYFNEGNLFYLQSNVTIPKSGFIENPHGRSLSNHTCSLKLTWILSIILIIRLFFSVY